MSFEQIHGLTNRQIEIVRLYWARSAAKRILWKSASTKRWAEGLRRYKDNKVPALYASIFIPEMAQESQTTKLRGFLKG
jgi:hypothetical protein